MWRNKHGAGVKVRSKVEISGTRHWPKSHQIWQKQFKKHQNYKYTLLNQLG